MIDLDIGTIQVMAFAMNLAAAFFIWTQRRPPVHSAALAARLWAAGFTLVAAGSLLVALRGMIPAGISVVLSDVLIVAGFALAITATRAFLSLPLAIWPCVAIVASVAAGAGWFYYSEPDGRYRLAVTLAAGAALCLWMLVSLRPWRSRRQLGVGSRIPAAVIAGVFGVALIVVTWRVVTGPPFNDILNLKGSVATTVAGLAVISIFYSLWALNLLGGRMGATLHGEIKRRDQLISLMAHDLKTPFNSLVGGTEAMGHLARMGRTDRALEMADDIHQAARQAHDLVDSLLAWVQSQPRELAPGPVSLRDALDTGHAQLRTAFEAKGIDFRPPDPEADATVLAHRGGLETVVRNLLANALKFSHSGGVVSASIEQSGGEARLVIRDDGIGMDPDTLARVKVAGSRHSRTGTAGEKGTGLGLTFCRDLVRSWRGVLRIDSAPGGGTAVTVSLPAADGPVRAARAEGD